MAHSTPSPSKKPLWACRCGFASNFASRSACRDCGATAPQKVLQAIQQAKKSTSQVQGTTGVAERQARQVAEARASKAEKQLKDLQKKLAAAESKVPPTTLADEEGGTENSAGTPEEKAQIKSLQEEIQWLKASKPGKLREQLTKEHGGFEAYLAKQEMLLQELQAKLRGNRPLAQQKVSAEAHMRKMQKARDEAAETLAALQEEQREVAKKLAKQEVAAAEAEEKLRRAKQENADLAERAAAELRGIVAHGPESLDKTSQLTAAAVLEFFKALPRAVVEHPEGKEKIEHVMGILTDLDTAGKKVTNPGAASTAVGTELTRTLPVDASSENSADCMDLDDEALDFLAGVVSEQTGGDEARSQQMADTKAKLKACPKVRKLLQKRSSTA
jgi:hypothetical protein